MIYSDITKLIGNTPIVELSRLGADVPAIILAKLESFNPAGSSKDRVGLRLLEDAEQKGLLKPGGCVIEPTSGNTGLGLAVAAALKGYRVILTMPDSMSPERQKLLKAYGAEIVLTDGKLGLPGSIERAKTLQAEIAGSFIAGQFTNPANPAAHYYGTGPEIREQLGDSLDIFVACAGTGGTISGTGKYLKEHYAGLRVVAVEPAGSPVLSGGKPGPHGLQGIGPGFVPEVLDRGVIDEIIQVTEEEAYCCGRRSARCEGVLVGITSGAALFAAMQLGRRPENVGKTILALLPDSGERYLSSPMFA